MVQGAGSGNQEESTESRMAGEASLGRDCDLQEGPEWAFLVARTMMAPGQVGHHVLLDGRVHGNPRDGYWW